MAPRKRTDASAAQTPGRHGADHHEGEPERIGPLGDPPEAIAELPDFWVVSDTHFGHRNIAMYANRPADHEQRMISAWQACVQPDDVVLHLGDIALGKAHDFAAYRDQLPGTIYLLLGNHDRRSMGFYRNHEVTPIKQSFILERRGWRFLMSHRPEMTRLAGSRWANIHGHIHQNTIRDRRAMNVCVEHTDYAPVRFSQLVAVYAT